MKTKVKKPKNKRKSLKRATKKVSKKTTKRRKKLLNYTNKNTRKNKNKKGGDAASVALPIAAAALIAGLAYKSKNIKNKTNKNNTPKYQYTHPREDSPPITKNGNGNGNGNEKNTSPIDVFLKKHHLVIEKVNDDGNCLFTAFLKILNKPDPETVEAVEDLRKKMVKWMQDDASKKRRSDQGPEKTFWEEFGDLITTQESYGRKNRDYMYNGYSDYETHMTRTDSDPDRPRAQFGGIFEIMALIEMHEADLEKLYGEGNLLQYVIVDENTGMLSLMTLPDQEMLPLDDVNTKLPILLLKDAHFEILKPNPSERSDA